MVDYIMEVAAEAKLGWQDILRGRYPQRGRIFAVLLSVYTPAFIVAFVVLPDW